MYPWQPSLIHFVDQGAIADAQCVRCFLEIAVVEIEGFDDHFPFDLSQGSPGDLLQ